MTRIGPTLAPPAPPAPDGVAPASAAIGLTAAPAVASPALVASPPQVLATAFDRLRVSSVERPGIPLETLVRDAVAGSLEAQAAALSGPVREALVAQISQTLLDDPGTRLRLMRLTGCTA